MVAPRNLLELARQHGTPLLVIDHNVLRANYRRFKEHLPRIQAYYAVKANSDAEVIKTLFDEGASFDVASYNEFMLVYEHIKRLDPPTKDHYIWDKIIFANTIKDRDTLRKIRRYKPLVTYDNEDEIRKIKDCCDTAGLVLRLKVPDIGSIVELSSKFGADPADACGLVARAFDHDLVVEGLSFHVGSQCTNTGNYVEAIEIASHVLADCRKKGYALKIIDIGGGFPVPYNADVPRFEKMAQVINAECERLFPSDVDIIAEPGRFIAATSAMLVSEIIGRARRDGKTFYYINDGVYHTFSGVVFDHWVPDFQAFRDGPSQVCAVVGPTCDSFDKITLSAQLPGDLDIGECLLTENIGAYSIASSTHFNGFEGAHILHVNQ